MIGVTRLGNWQEEEALKEATGFSRVGPRPNCDNGARVIDHTERVKPKDYRSTASVSHCLEGGAGAQGKKVTVGPRARRDMVRMEMMVRGEEAVEQEALRASETQVEMLSTTAESYAAPPRPVLAPTQPTMPETPITLWNEGRADISFRRESTYKAEERNALREPAETDPSMPSAALWEHQQKVLGLVKTRLHQKAKDRASWPDFEGRNVVEPVEFKAAMDKWGLVLTKTEIAVVAEIFSPNDGLVHLDELFRYLAPAAPSPNRWGD